MAVTNTSTSKSRTEYTTDLTDSTTGTNVTIITLADAKRVTGINVFVSVGASDNNVYTAAQIEAVHTAIVAALNAKIGAGI